MAYDAERGLVMVKMNNGRTLRFSQDTLSAKDIEYLKTAKPVSPIPSPAKPVPFRSSSRLQRRKPTPANR